MLFQVGLGAATVVGNLPSSGPVRAVKNYSIPQSVESDWTAPSSKMTIQVLGGETSMVVPYAPREVTYSNKARGWVTINRDGDRTPLLVPGTRPLPTLGFELFLGYSGWEMDCTAHIQALESLADSDRPLLVVWSGSESGLWRITELNITSMLRHRDTSEVVRAKADVTMTRASDSVGNVGPTTGGASAAASTAKNNKTKRKNAVTNKGDNVLVPAKYTVKSGDTLNSIGMKFFKDHKAWKFIAEVNQIKNPKTSTALKAGSVIKLVR